MHRKLLLAMCLLAAVAGHAVSPTSWVDPMIGSKGLGRTYIGPCMPYGMIKPSPDGVSMPNSGWAPMPEPIKGFSQVHVSGTGGGQKYGNILIRPFADSPDASLAEADFRAASDERLTEVTYLGYYATLLRSGVNVEVTSADRAAIYRIAYPPEGAPGLYIDAGAFLGESPVPDLRETQQLVGSQIEVVSDREIRGYNRVRGGWNNGRAYTVYFHAVSDVPFADILTFKDSVVSRQLWQSDTHQATGAIAYFPEGTRRVMLKIGISYISELKARENLMADIPGMDFDGTLSRCEQAWAGRLGRISLAPSATDEQRRMFYTALYHTMLMPTDRSGENPLWADDTPYYDDYYAIWDTYRTSMPLLTLIDTQRQVDMVNSLLNIYRRDGYMPDARSGNANGRTQGGSNAEIAIADAFVKGLDGIDYELALEAMLKDADVPPGGLEEAEGRGGLVEYNTLGYVPFGIPRSGNRTVEYAFCDYAIAQVARGLGRGDVALRFDEQSRRWRNLWRSDYEHSGVKGFIMPRDRQGEWLDSLPQGHSAHITPRYEYTAMTFEGPWYTPWWSMVFYEAPSWEYSLSIPHDVPGLIEMCGGAGDFERRLDVFFDRGYYNVNNEPSFLSPCLYHWIGKPWRSTDRVHQIVAENFSDSMMGLPGNDDSGAMSSWLAFHMLGLYPNAGHDYYLINTPMVEGASFALSNGNVFTIATDNFADGNKYIVSATLNGADYPYSSISHADIMAGGELRLTLGSAPAAWGASLAPASPQRVYTPAKTKALPALASPDGADMHSLLFTFRPHGQTRRYRMDFTRNPDGSLTLLWGIERNLKWQSGTYTVSARACKGGDVLDFSMPVDGEHVALPDNTTAYVISTDAYRSLLKKGVMRYNRSDFSLVDDPQADSLGLLHVANDEGCEMWILKNPDFPLVWAVQGNPLEVNYTVTQYHP